MIRPVVVFLTAALLLGLAGCGSRETMSGQIHPSSEAEAAIDTETVLPETETAVQTGLFPEQILSGEAGDIHYSYYLPEGYDGRTEFPMMVVMPACPAAFFFTEEIAWIKFLDKRISV